MDDDTLPQASLRANLADLRRANRWLGGTALVRHYLLPRIQALPPGYRPTLLDVGTGGADIPSAFLGWLGQQGQRGWCVGADVSQPVIGAARQWVTSGGSVCLTQADGRALPWPNESFDFVLCTLTAHHLSEAGVVALLGEMARVARRTVLVTDLDRSRLALVGVWLAAHLTLRSPLTRHDGPLSVRRAYTVREARALAGQAGLPAARARAHPLFRWALVWDRADQGSRGAGNPPSSGGRRMLDDGAGRGTDGMTPGRDNARWDVVVVGGRPAGAVTAAWSLPAAGGCSWWTRPASHGTNRAPS